MGGFGDNRYNGVRRYFREGILEVVKEVLEAMHLSFSKFF